MAGQVSHFFSELEWEWLQFPWQPFASLPVAMMRGLGCGQSRRFETGGGGGAHGRA